MSQSLRSKQLKVGHLELALTYAADIKFVHLADALRILELMARDADHVLPSGDSMAGAVRC